MQRLFCHVRFSRQQPSFFAATFLKKRAFNRWQQNKQKFRAKTLVPLTWAKFKILLRKNLGEIRVFGSDI